MKRLLHVFQFGGLSSPNDSTKRIAAPTALAPSARTNRTPYAMRRPQRSKTGTTPLHNHSL